MVFRARVNGGVDWRREGWMTEGGDEKIRGGRNSL